MFMLILCIIFLDLLVAGKYLLNSQVSYCKLLDNTKNTAFVV